MNRLVASGVLVSLAGLTAATPATPQSASGQGPLEALLERTAAYAQVFIDDFSNVVAEEIYRQQFRLAAGRRELKSDFLLVAYPGEKRVVQTFRDVLEVNGKPVQEQQERLTKLFLEPFESAMRRAGEISRSSERYGDSRGRLMDPLQVIAFLQAAYRQNFVFELRGVEAGVREMAFWQSNVPVARRGSAIQGRAWVDEGSGRITRTEMRTGVSPIVRITVTTFGRDAGLGIDVPIEMRDDAPYGFDDEFQGRATYGRFRRFQVRAQETIDVPATPR